VDFSGLDEFSGTCSAVEILLISTKEPNYKIRNPSPIKSA
jgi:hypothetical protein